LFFRSSIVRFPWLRCLIQFPDSFYDFLVIEHPKKIIDRLFAISRTRLDVMGQDFFGLLDRLQDAFFGTHDATPHSTNAFESEQFQFSRGNHNDPTHFESGLFVEWRFEWRFSGRRRRQSA
jgi:hypothetical protein